MDNNNTTETINGRSVEATTVAKLIVDDEVIPHGTKERQIFGKKFEHSYQQICWIWQDIVEWIGSVEEIQWHNEHIEWKGKCPTCGKVITPDDKESMMAIPCEECHRWWHDSSCDAPILIRNNRDESYHLICEECMGTVVMRTFTELMDEDNELMDEALINEAREIAMGFLETGIYGKIPKTKFRHLYDDMYIAAKPDLYDINKGKGYIEFKTYPIGEYPIVQCKIFSWILGEPITLVGWNDGEVQQRVINADEKEFQKNIPEIPEEYFNDSHIYTDRIINY